MFLFIIYGYIMTHYDEYIIIMMLLKSLSDLNITIIVTIIIIIMIIVMTIYNYYHNNYVL